MKRTLYVIASTPDLAESIAFLSRNADSVHELAAHTAEEAARSLADMRTKPRHRRANWLDRADIYEVAITITRVN